MQKSKKPRENQKKQKNKKNNIPGLLPVDPISRLLEYCFFWFFCFFWFSRGFLDFCIFTFARVLEYWFFWCFWFFWFSPGVFGFLLLQESWNIVFFLVFWFSRGFLVFFYNIVKPQVQIPIKHAMFFWGGTIYIYISGRDFPGRISAGTKLTCNSFLIHCKLAFILINVHFSLFFPWFQCYALFCCKYLYGIAPF